MADFFVQKRLKGKYNPPQIPIRHVDAFLKLLAVMVGDKRYQEIMEEMKQNEKEEGEVTMCEIYDQIEGQGIQKGIQKGIQMERVHTREQEKRADAAEAEVRRLQKLLADSGKQTNA